MLFLREIKGLEARQRLEALVIPKRQALTRLQGLLAPLIQLAEMVFSPQIKTSIFRLIGYIPKQLEDSARRQLSESGQARVDTPLSQAFSSTTALQLGAKPGSRLSHTSSVRRSFG
jgi:hypothetical protein